MIITEYDVVRATRQLSQNVSKGTLGTVLILYTDNPTAYEVEFVDHDGESLEILTVEEKDIERYYSDIDEC